MYGLPKDFDGKFLIGHTLEMVCFNQTQVYLHFDKSVTIAVESAFSYKQAHMVSVPVRESNLMELLGVSVSNVRADRDGTLILELDDGQQLAIYDTTPQYESYTITYEGKTIIV